MRKTRKALAATASTALALVSVALFASPASADEETWGFEQVTPVEKGDGALSYADTFRTSLDGNSFLYSTQTPFLTIPTESVGVYNRYLGLRGTEGWSNSSVDPPFDLSVFDLTTKNLNMATIRSSENLKYAMVASTEALTPGANQGGSNLYLRNTHNGEYTLIATDEETDMIAPMTAHLGTESAIYVSPDGDSAVFMTDTVLTADPPAPGPPNPGDLIYRWTSESGLEPVSVLPDAMGGGTVNATYLEQEGGARSALPEKSGIERFHFVVINGSTRVVYLRENGETKLITRSHRAADDPTAPVNSRFQAVSGDGRYSLFFTQGNNTPLTDDTPAVAGASYLYRHDAEDDSLTYIGYSTSSSTMWTTEMSDDGETIAFRSRAALHPDAVANQTNHYIWRDGGISFVTGVPSGTVSYGNGFANWKGRLSESGRYYAFTDNAASTAALVGFNNSSPACGPLPGIPGPCDQVYVYDVVEDELSCASCRTDGEPLAGDAGDPSAGNSGYQRMDGRIPQFVADDGTVYFTTYDPLVSNDVNGAPDVYAYAEGQQRLISRASQDASYTRFLDSTSDGERVFFATNDAIVPTDTDNAVDVYATGPGAGFDYTPPDITPPCEGAECREQTDSMPLLPPTGSIDFQGGGNAKDDGKVVVQRAGNLKGSKIRLRITVPSAGKLAIGGNKVRNKRKSVNEAGNYRISTRLTKKAGKKLKRKRQMNVPVRVRFNPESGSASSLRFAVAMKANSKQKGR